VSKQKGGKKYKTGGLSSRKGSTKPNGWRWKRQNKAIIVWEGEKKVARIIFLQAQRGEFISKGKKTWENKIPSLRNWEGEKSPEGGKRALEGKSKLQRNSNKGGRGGVSGGGGGAASVLARSKKKASVASGVDRHGWHRQEKEWKNVNTSPTL